MAYFPWAFLVLMSFCPWTFVLYAFPQWTFVCPRRFIMSSRKYTLNQIKSQTIEIISRKIKMIFTPNSIDINLWRYWISYLYYINVIGLMKLLFDYAITVHIAQNDVILLSTINYSSRALCYCCCSGTSTFTYTNIYHYLLELEIAYSPYS